MKAQASSTKGDALEQKLTLQVEEDAETSLMENGDEQLPQTCNIPLSVLPCKLICHLAWVIQISYPEAQSSVVAYISFA